MFSDPYLIPGTTCLRNHLHITDEADLATTEGAVAFARETELSRRSLPGKYDVRHLSAFHARLFGDIYPWAGEFRTVGINKGGTEFCRPQFLADQVSGLLATLQQDRLLIGLNRRAFVAKLAYYYGELNVCHPFREGNGRTQRAFLRQLAAAAGYRLSWSAMTAEENIDACQKYYVTQDLGSVVPLIESITSRL